MPLPNYLIQYPAAGNGEQPRPVSSNTQSKVLAASVAKTFTVPTGAKKVIFGFTNNTWVNCYTTAAVPAADITDGTSSELNPVSYLLSSDITSISVLSATAGAIAVAAFYS